MNYPQTGRISMGEMIEGNADAIFILDSHNNVIAWNRQMEVQISISESDASGRSIETLVPQFSNPDFNESVQRAIHTEAFVSKNIYQFSLKNKILFLQAGFSPVKWGIEVSCMIILRELNRSEIDNDKFKSLIEYSPLVTALYEPNGKPKYFNQAFRQLWGATEDMVGKMMEEYNVLEDGQLLELGVMPFIQKGFAGEQSEIPPIEYANYKTKATRHLGEKQRKYIKGHIYPLKDVNGGVKEVAFIMSDITFQQQAEQILTDTHLKLQMLTLGLPGVIYEFEEGPNGHTIFKYISDGCEKMFGFTSEEIRNDSSLLNKVIHPDDAGDFWKTSELNPEGFKEWHWEGRIIVDGRIKWIEGKTSPVNQHNGITVKYGLLLDITDRKEVEKRYKLSEQRLQLALHGADMGLWEWDVDGIKTTFNESWVQKLGYEEHELQLRFEDWVKLIHPEDLPKVKEKFYAHLKGYTSNYEAEYRFLKKDGTYRWLLDRGKVTKRNDKGKVSKVSGTYLDIDDKKNSETIIQKNELLFSQLFDGSPIGIVLLDERHQVVQMNQGFKDMFGFPEEIVLGNMLNNILVPDDLKQQAMDINILIAGGQVGILESKRNHFDGHLVPVIIYGVPVTFENETIGIYGIYVDITDRVKVENELQVRNNELDNFVYKVSHDLRAPLSSILGLVNLANHELNEDDLHEYIKLIENRVKQLDGFINDVLSHSKNLKLAVTVDSIDFGQIIENCFNDLSYLPKAGILKKEISISEKPFFSDRWRINEIFRNLISNAIKYLSPARDNPYVKIVVNVTDDFADIHLEDNGIGIKNATLPKIFEMFFRATEYSQGSGIGLYIVQNAIEKLGGTVSVTSELDKGTIFKIAIPNSKPGNCPENDK